MQIIENIRMGGKVLAGKLLRKRSSLSVEFGITYQCGLACKYCLLGDPENYFDPDKCSVKQDMSLSQVRKVLSILGHLGVERINLSGGEPLFRKDIDKVLESAFLLKSKISLTTNGLLVPQYLDLLQKLDFLCISINGDKKTHDHLAGAQTHDAVMRAIALSKARGIQVLISSVITACTTEDDLRFLLGLADRYDMFCVFQPVFEGGYFEKGYVRFNEFIPVVPTSGHLEGLFESIKNNPYRKRVVGGRNFIEFVLKFSREKARGLPRPRPCTAGNGFFYISPSGDMFPCSLRFQKLLKGKFYECSLQEIGKMGIGPVQCPGCCCYSNNILDKIGRFDLQALAGVLMDQYVQ